MMEIKVQSTRLKYIGGKGLIELNEPSDTFNYKPFLKYHILQTISHVFLLFIVVWNKIFYSKY